MMKKNFLLTFFASALLLGACGEDEAAVTTTDDTAAEESTESETTEIETEDTSADDEVVEDTSEEDLPEQQVGDVIEEEGMSRTIVATNYGINQTAENGPFTLTLLNSQVSHLVIDDEDTAEFFGGNDLAMVSFEVEVSNNSEETNTIYPDQGTIVTNTGNQVDADVWMSDSVGGDFLGEVTKSGDVFFFYEGNPEDITNVRYIISSGHDEDFESFGEDIEFSIDF